MRSSSNGERKLSKSHDVQQLALCHRLLCQSARPHVISTSTNVPQLNPFLHLHRLSTRLHIISMSTNVPQLNPFLHLHRLSTRPHIISTSTNIPQLNPFFHLYRLFNRKCNVYKLTDVWQYVQTWSLHLPPLSNGPSNLLASPSPIRRPMKTQTIVGLHLHPLTCRLSF